MVIIAYEPANALSGIKEYNCYYGENDNVINQKGTVVGTTCSFKNEDNNNNKTECK